MPQAAPFRLPFRMVSSAVFAVFYQNDSKIPVGQADLESNSGFSSIYQVTNMEPLAFLYDENNDGGYGGAISGMGMD